MDLEPGKTDGRRKKVTVKNGRGTKVGDGDTGKRGEKTEDAAEPLPKRILRSASKKISLAPLPAVVEIKNPKGKAVPTSRKPIATVTSSKDKVVEKKRKITKTAIPTSSKSKKFSGHKNAKKEKKPVALSNSTTKKVSGTNRTLSSKNATSLGKAFSFQEELSKIEDLDTTMGQEIQEKKNPMLLSPIIRCIFGFLDIKNVKTFRFVSREWSSAGQQALISQASIRFFNGPPDRLPNGFYSCFPNSAARFSSFKILGGFWTIEELSKFFDEQQKSIKELEFRVVKFIKDKTTVNNFDISPWISKSLIVKSDVKYLTKLEIRGVKCAIPLSLIKHIKDLALSYCRVNLETGVQIHPVKLYLEGIDFYQDETLPIIQINDIVRFSSAKEIYLDGFFFGTGRTEFAIDLSGNCSLESLTLRNMKIVNWETLKWDIQYLSMDYMDTPTITQMTIRELYLSLDTGDFDLFSLPRSIEKLGIGERTAVKCSQPITLEKLKYFNVGVNTETNFAFLSHFTNCPQLAHLKFSFEDDGSVQEIKLSTIPKTVKTITLENCSIDWVYGSCSYETIEKLIFHDVEINFRKICNAKISVDDMIIICDKWNDHTSFQSLANFFKYEKRFRFCKRFYIGELNWDDIQLEDSENDQITSAFSVFEIGGMGRALDKISFYQLADLPKHIVLKRD